SLACGDEPGELEVDRIAGVADRRAAVVETERDLRNRRRRRSGVDSARRKNLVRRTAARVRDERPAVAVGRRADVDGLYADELRWRRPAPPAPLRPRRPPT